MNGFGKIQIHQVLISLLFGVILGMLIQQGLFYQRHLGLHGHGGMKKHMMERLDHDLALTSEQKEKIEAIFEAKRPQMKALRDEVHPRFEELHQKTQAEIRAVLNPEQQKKFDEISARMEKRFKEKFMGRDGGPDWPRD